MYANALYAVLLGMSNHRLEMVDMGMYISVGEKTDEMERGSICLHIFRYLAPCLAGKESAALDRLRNKLCALRENLTAAERVVTDLGISHIVIGGKSDSRSVRLEFEAGIFCHEHIERGGISLGDSVAVLAVSDTYAVHNDGYDRARNADGIFHFIKNKTHFSFLSIIY